MNEAQIAKMMKALDLTREEAIELIKSDEEVDKMTTKQATADLTAEQKKAVKKATITTSGKSKTATTPVKRERKTDNVKVTVIESVAHQLTRCVFEDDTEIQNIQIVKPEKEITFTINGEEYSLSLTKHRKK